FFSAWSIATKAAGTLGGSLGLWALAWIGFDAGRDALNTPEAIAGLRYVYVFLPSTMFILAGLVIWKYPMTRERQTRIRAAIDRRDARRSAAALAAAG
ncbi:MAG: MFS transporter, partial [Pseudomonadales bacterium]